MPPKINEMQQMALCCRVLYNHIRQMAPIVDADANSLVSQGTGRTRGGLCHESIRSLLNAPWTIMFSTSAHINKTCVAQLYRLSVRFTYVHLGLCRS